MLSMILPKATASATTSVLRISRAISARAQAPRKFSTMAVPGRRLPIPES